MVFSADLIVAREARIDDMEELFEMVNESTKVSTKLTVDSLRDDLFGASTSNHVELLNEDPDLEFDIDQLQSNRPVARAIVAEVNSKLVGYLIYHYHLSPWVGNMGFVDDVFTRPKYRRKGVARKLIETAIGLAKAESLVKFMFNVGRMSPEMKQLLATDGKSKWYRNDGTDWSVLRIEFSENDHRTQR